MGASVGGGLARFSFLHQNETPPVPLPFRALHQSANFPL
jgi:hypothetical protein